MALFSALLLALFVCATFPASGHAGDGRIEINQAGLVGFPVILSQRGSYVLTSNLLVPNFVTPALEIAVDEVTIDLNGFTIDGPVTCTTMSCTVAGGIAIDGGTQRGITIRNGVIRQFGGGGILVGDDALIQNVTVHETGGVGIQVQHEGQLESCHVSLTVDDGIRAGDDAVIRGCTIHDAGADGVEVGPGSIVRDSVVRSSSLAGLRADPASIFADNTFQSNSGGDVVGGRATSGNYCSDGSCSRIPLRRFYLTKAAAFTGLNALSACEPGFHMASLWEMWSTSDLRYDTTLGETDDDSGEGPTTMMGWARTGLAARSTTSFGNAPSNCLAWTSDDSNHTGAGMRLEPIWDSTTAGDQPIQPWDKQADLPCDGPERVWCIED